MDNNNFSLTMLKQLDIVDYLNKLGYLPTKINGSNYWFLSPLRVEKEASFKVDRKQNVWYDHGIGKGGNLIDFGILHFNCSVKEFLHKMVTEDFPFHQQLVKSDSINEKPENKIILKEVQPIKHLALIGYLQERKIPLEIALRYCKQVNYQLMDKHYYALGFANDSGGYELRNKYFKGSSSPKNSTLIRKENAEILTVFEGFFSFLSYQSIFKDKIPPVSDFLVLNSLSFTEKNIDRMQSYVGTKLMLDNDLAGNNATEKLLSISTIIKDGRKLYQKHKDLNEFLIKQNSTVQKIIPQKSIAQKWNRHL